MSKPTPKQNFLQTALFAIVIWSAMMLFCNKPQTPQDAFGQNIASAQAKLEKNENISPERDKAYEQLVQDNKDVKDLTIVQHNNSYQDLVNKQENLKQITKDDADERRLEGTLMVADTQRKAGLLRNETTRLRTAYQTLKPQKRNFENTPLWTKPIATFPAHDGVPAAGSSAKDLYQTTFDTLNARNHTEKVWGFLPGYETIDFLVHATGANPGFSYALACFLLALLVRAVVYPLTEKQLLFSRKMMQLAPLSNEIRKEYKDDQTTQQQKIMELYKEYGINPFAGCLPSVLQMPLFFSIYQFMLHYQFEFTKGTFLWINPTVAKLTNHWTAPNLGETDYPLIVIYGVTMLISTLLAPISDPSQAKQQRLMTVGITVTFMISMFFYPLPSAFVLYWTFTNLLSMAQSLRAYRRKMPPLEKVNAAGGGVYPKKGGGIGGKWMEMMEEAQRQAAEAKAKEQGNNGKPGASNGKPGAGQIIKNGELKTGAPAKHKPKKRK